MLALAKHVKMQRYNLSSNQVIKEDLEQLKINKSLVVTMLSSLDPKKRYLPPKLINLGGFYKSFN